MLRNPPERLKKFYVRTGPEASATYVNFSDTSTGIMHYRSPVMEHRERDTRDIEIPEIRRYDVTVSPESSPSHPKKH